MHDAPEVSCAEGHVAVPPATLSRPSANHTPPEGWRRLRARRAPTLRRAGTRDAGGNVLRVASPTGWYFRLPILMASDESMRSGREGSGSTGDVGASCERLDRVCQDAPGGETHARTHLTCQRRVVIMIGTQSRTYQPISRGGTGANVSSPSLPGSRIQYPLSKTRQMQIQPWEADWGCESAVAERDTPTNAAAQLSVPP